MKNANLFLIHFIYVSCFFSFLKRGDLLPRKLLEPLNRFLKPIVILIFPFPASANYRGKGGRERERGGGRRAIDYSKS